MYQSHDIFIRFFSELKFCPVTSIPPSPNSGIAGKIPVKRTRKFREKLNQDKKKTYLSSRIVIFMRLGTYVGFHESTFYYCFFRLNSRYSTLNFLIKKKNSCASPYSSCRVFQKTILVLPSRAEAQWEDNFCCKCHWLEVDVEVLFQNASFKIPLHVWRMQSHFPECYLWVILYFFLLFLLRICYTSYYIDIYD